MPNSGTSSPSSSTSWLTRESGTIALTILKTTNVNAERVDRAERRAAQLQQELLRVAVKQARDTLPALPRYVAAPTPFQPAP